MDMLIYNIDIMEKLKNLITKIMVSAITMEEHN